MLIGTRQVLQKAQEDQVPLKGTLAVIDGNLDFRNTDGFIQFMKLALDQIPKTYGKQDPKWQEYFNKLYTAAEKLKADNTRFTGYTTDEFREYCEKLSHIMETDTVPSLNVLSIDIATGDDLVPFLEEHVDKGNTRAFYYENTEDDKKELMHDLMNQLSGIKFEKTQRQHDISRFLTLSGYHEHVHDALNVILAAAVYAINCSSTRKKDAYSFDTQKICNDLKYAEVIMERTAHLV